MTVGVRYFAPYAFAVNVAGVPYVGGQLFFYASGTSTPADTWEDVNLTTPNANPVVADSSGTFPSIWLSPTQSYKVVLEDTNSVQVWTADPVGPAAGGATQSFAGVIGEVRMFAGPSTAIPQQWYACYGQAVSRTTYSAAFAVLGTAYGSGDGSTTFNLPDLRGRVIAGLDNMGGTAASRLTAGVSGVPGTTLGGSGGDQHAQQDTLTATTAITDPGHTHVANAVTTPSSTPGIGIAGFGAGYSWPAATIDSATTGITATTTVTSSLAGAAQNVQPVTVMNAIIYLGA